MKSVPNDPGLRLGWPKRGGVYVLVTERLSALPFTQTIEACLRGGATAVQLREKEISNARFVELGKVAREITAEHGGCLIINDRPEVAAACEADGVHLGENDPDLVSVRAWLGDAAILGATTHTLDEAVRAVNEGADYLGVGPIFKTVTKRIDSPRGTGLFREIQGSFGLPCFPLGGIDLGNVGEVVAAGARGVAVCQGVISNPDMEEIVRQLASCFERGEGR